MADTSSSQVLRLPIEWQPLVVTAALLQRFEARGQPMAPEQYRALAQQAQTLLDSATPGPALDALLQAFPVLRDLYENSHYEHAGLCRHPLDAALAAEQAARQALQRAAH